MTPSMLGWAQLGTGVGLVLVYPITVTLIHRKGAHFSARLAGIGLWLSLIVLAVLPNWIWLGVGLGLLGACMGSFDVSINALSSRIEHKSGMNLMSGFHAWFGIGVLVGSLLASAASWAQMIPFFHFGILFLTLIIPILLMISWTSGIHAEEEVPENIFTLPRGETLILGMIIFFAAINEGSIANWIAIYFTDHVGVSEALAPVGLAIYSISMIISRMAGDRLKSMFSSQKIMIAAMIIAFLGLLIVVLNKQFFLVCIGFGIAALGIAIVFPFVFSIVGKQGSQALAAVATMGYIAGMFGPPSIGMLVDAQGLPFTFTVFGMITLIIAFFAFRSRLMREN